MPGLGKPLPYISGGIAVVLGLLISFFLYSTTNIVSFFATVLPAPLTLSAPAAIVIFGLLLAIVIKLLDAPLANRQRFRTLESKLARRQGVRDPAALAAYIERRRRRRHE